MPPRDPTQTCLQRPRHSETYLSQGQRYLAEDQEMLPSIDEPIYATHSDFGVLLSPVYPPTAHDLDRFSHLGGLPSLPPGMEWPRSPKGVPFHFLAQIDLATVPTSGIVDFLGRPLSEFPREGALYFFADCTTFGIWEKPEASHRTLYAPDLGGTRPVQPPPDLMPHNAPDAGVLVHTQAPYFPGLSPRPMMLLPHVPLSLTGMPSVPPRSEVP